VKITLLCVGKLRDASVRTLCADYAVRLKRYGTFEIEEVKASSAPTPPRAVAEEGTRLLHSIAPGARVWVLDERGPTYPSVHLARRLSELELRATKCLVVVLGGAYGLNDEVRKRGELLALSPMTFNHELCRVLVLEQLYRMRTIQRGEPYHH